jgi:hypothetical protein
MRAASAARLQPAPTALADAAAAPMDLSTAASTEQTADSAAGLGVRQTRASQRRQADSGSVNASGSLPGLFLVINLAIESHQRRPFGISRFLRGGLQLDPPRDENRTITVEVWEPVDSTDLFGAYCAKSPAEEAQILQGAVLYFDASLDMLGRPDPAVCVSLMSDISMKRAVDKYHEWAKEVEFDVDDD